MSHFSNFQKQTYYWFHLCESYKHNQVAKEHSLPSPPCLSLLHLLSSFPFLFFSPFLLLFSSFPVSPLSFFSVTTQIPHLSRVHNEGTLVFTIHDVTDSHFYHRSCFFRSSFSPISCISRKPCGIILCIYLSSRWTGE